jgi:hypothetical protein
MQSCVCCSGGCNECRLRRASRVLDPLRIFDSGHAVQRSAGLRSLYECTSACTLNDHGVCLLLRALGYADTAKRRTRCYLRSKILDVAVILPVKSPSVCGLRRFFVRRVLLGRYDRICRHWQVAWIAGSAPENNVDVNPAGEQSNRFRSTLGGRTRRALRISCRSTSSVHFWPGCRVDLASAAVAAVVLFSTGNETMITLLCSTPISVNACSRRNSRAEG